MCLMMFLLYVSSFYIAVQRSTIFRIFRKHRYKTKSPNYHYKINIINGYNVIRPNKYLNNKI